jgi:hypothetical protein
VFALIGVIMAIVITTLVNPIIATTIAFRSKWNAMDRIDGHVTDHMIMLHVMFTMFTSWFEL